MNYNTLSNIPSVLLAFVSFYILGMAGLALDNAINGGGFAAIAWAGFIVLFVVAFGLFWIAVYGVKKERPDVVGAVLIAVVLFTLYSSGMLEFSTTNTQLQISVGIFISIISAVLVGVSIRQIMPSKN